MDNKEQKQELIDYIYEFAWQYGRLFHTEQSNEERLKAISKKFMLPEQFLEMKKLSNEDEKRQHAIDFVKFSDENLLKGNSLQSYDELYKEFLNRK